MPFKLKYAFLCDQIFSVFFTPETVLLIVRVILKKIHYFGTILRGKALRKHVGKLTCRRERVPCPPLCVQFVTFE